MGLYDIHYPLDLPSDVNTHVVGEKNLRGITLLGGLLLVRNDLHVLEINGRELDINPYPHLLLYTLGSAANQIVSTPDLLECVWGDYVTEWGPTRQQQGRVTATAKALRDRLDTVLEPHLGINTGKKLIVSEARRGYKFVDETCSAK